MIDLYNHSELAYYSKRSIITHPKQVTAGSYLWDPAVHSFAYMHLVPDCRVPGHQFFQFFVSRRLAEVWHRHRIGSKCKKRIRGAVSPYFSHFSDNKLSQTAFRKIFLKISSHPVTNLYDHEKVSHNAHECLVDFLARPMLLYRRTSGPSPLSRSSALQSTRFR